MTEMRGSARHQAQLVQFAEALAQGRAVAQIAAGDDEVVGNVPIEGLGNFEGGRLLALEPVGIDRVEQIDGRFLHDLR